jgi:nicotinate-nucleotide adenylyltransferase
MRSGIFGGSFDPIHLGHLIVADDVLRKLALDRVVFVPAFHPPHRNAPLADYRHRLEMVRRATKFHSQFEASAVESGKPGPSFTVDTLAALRAANPADRLYFILGQDQYAAMGHWHRPGELPRLARLVVMSRPGTDRPPLFPGHSAACVRFLDVTPVAVSAAAIRARLAKGASVSYILPTSVQAYLRQHRLYRNRPDKGEPCLE